MMGSNMVEQSCPPYSCWEAESKKKSLGTKYILQKQVFSDLLPQALLSNTAVSYELINGLIHH
jgi:hypothetical protein